ncbi:MAG: magnesium transporter [Solirubrobacterales bacterium]
MPIYLPTDSAGHVRDSMVGRRFDQVEEIVVVEEGNLVGMLRLNELLEAAPDARLSELVTSSPVVLEPGTTGEAAAWQLAREGQANLAVTDDEGKFSGLVPAHQLIGHLLTNHDEDVARLGGYLASTNSARLAAEEPIRRRLRHRLPWLLVGLVGAMLSAILVGSFEAQLDAKVLLAFFVPAVVYMADAVGTQTETLLIRGMSANIDMKKVVRREMATGVIMGVLVGAAFYPFALVGWGDEKVALAVALALFASCAMATTVATVLPRVLAHFGTDPAFGAGPLATIVQDLLSIAVYLAIAIPIAT